MAKFKRLVEFVPYGIDKLMKYLSALPFIDYIKIRKGSNVLTIQPPTMIRDVVITVPVDALKANLVTSNENALVTDMSLHTAGDSKKYLHFKVGGVDYWTPALLTVAP